MDKNDKRGRTTSDRREDTGASKIRSISDARSRISTRGQTSGRQNVQGREPVRRRIRDIEPGGQKSADRDSLRQGPADRDGMRQRSAQPDGLRQSLKERGGIRRPGAPDRDGAGQSITDRDGSRQRSADRDGLRQRSADRDVTRAGAVDRDGTRAGAADNGLRTRTQQDAPGQEGRRQPGQGIKARKQQSQRPGSGRKQPRKQQSRRKRQRNLVLKAAFVVILVIAAVAAAFLWKKYSPSKKEYDLAKYYGIENEGQLAVIVDDQVVAPHGMIADGKAYVQYDIVRDYINSRFYWDPNENVLLYTLPKDMVTVEVGSKDYNVSKEKKSEDYVILKTEGSTAYIALDFIQQYTNMEYELYNDPNRVMIECDWGEKTVATVKKNTQVRYQGGVKSPILSQLKKKDEVVVLENEDDWKKVLTKDGFIGYVKTKALKGEEKKVVDRAFEEPEFTSIKKDYIINMAWHNVTNNDANSQVLQRIADSKGLTTIAPTWFHVQDTEGNMDSIASADYVNYAHQANIEVWVAIRDFDGGINSYDESYEMLRYTSRRENLINQLISEALRVGVDGINVDFEKISDECGEHYIQFIRELSVRCRQNGLILSIDNYVPKGYNMQYNRKEQGIVADYIIIMGYDEHYAGSPTAGPVASYNFVREGIEETLKEVPAEKVISGIPFFSRLWTETPKTAEELAEQAGTEEAENPMKVDSEALGMSNARTRVEESGAEITWDEETKQNYATWTVESATYKIWLEDEQSIEPKLALMKEHKLAGTAAWALGQESTEIWNLIQKYVN
ncbi:MAG: glycosyl hydrolase family 18 [Lachnospiraceae bacterium]